MKKQKKFNLFSEVKDILVTFFRPCRAIDTIFELPKDVKSLGMRNNWLMLISTIISLVFSFMLKGSNMLIEHKFILLGIMMFMLYRSHQLLSDSLFLLRDSEDAKFSLIFNDEVVLKGSSIIGKVSNRVSKYDAANNLYRIMDNESIVNSIRRYLQTLWRVQIGHMFAILDTISVIIMLVVAIITNDAMPQHLFIPLLLTFVGISFTSSAYINIQRDEFHQKHRKSDDEQSLILNDMLRTPSIVNRDLEMRITRFQKTMVESNHNIKNFHKKMNISRIIVSALELISQYGIIIFYLLGIEWSSISLATIAEMTANLVIVETALGYVSRISRMMSDHREKIIVMKNEEKDINLILKVFHSETEKFSSCKPIEAIEIAPFTIKYSKASENDKPFELISERNIIINSGEIAILYGPSGSGKSTFEKMLTGRISLEKSTEIPSTTRFLFYDETLEFGSMTLYEELFCGEASPSLIKMQEILENLHLWSEIQSNCLDVWEWLKTKNFRNSLSNGQKQRLILAKMLYWMDSDIDVLVLDEATSGLDDKVETSHADAEKILEYIVRYANKDKKRIVVISTHQNIDGFVSHLNSEYIFKSFSFEKEGDKNLIKEV
ncbi:MAG: ATP-binding cassette domain-containing protein [Clostridia bacterium]|nr:ATP-binding cassette domain-containing protein [Clostridia bacterium]